MLQAIGNLNKANSTTTYHPDLLHDLSHHEASLIAAGFSIVNATDRTQAFYPFSENISPKVKFLQPGQQGNYQGNYVLYNSSRTSYVPRISEQLDPSGEYKFSTQGDETLFGGVARFF